MIEILAILALLQIKHWYVDFVIQTMDEVNGKGIYGNWQGIKHSLKHGVATMLVLFPFMWYAPEFVLILGFFDFITHYHIDWAKMNWGNRDITTPAFWAHLGLDQMMHQFVYLIIIGLIV